MTRGEGEGAIFVVRGGGDTSYFGSNLANPIPLDLNLMAQYSCWGCVGCGDVGMCWCVLQLLAQLLSFNRKYELFI